MSKASEDAELRALVAGLDDDEVAELVASLPPAAAEALLDLLGAAQGQFPVNPIAQAALVDMPFTERPHLTYLSDRIAQALKKVEQGENQRLIIEMPPRAGKTTLTTLLTPAWIMAQHPSWPIALTSHDGSLATSWGRTIRRWAEDGLIGGVRLSRDAGAASAWETTEGGKMLSISIRESFTGRGAKVLVIDDPHKDMAEAQSATLRSNIWDWWLSVAQTRLEPPYLVLVVATRWHEDDFIGRLLDPDKEGDPSQWEVIRLPALAEDADDVLGRSEGEPLLSALDPRETLQGALVRWSEVRQNVGEYVWAAMMQQRPAPAKGAIFDTGWWKFWTSNPQNATPDGQVVYFDPHSAGRSGKWLDSWDAAFKGNDDSDYVVGQRWVRLGPTRYLVAQKRSRLSFTQTIRAMEDWADPSSLYGAYVHQRLIEEKANGSAIIDVLKETLSGIKAITPAVGKDARARSVTPEIESGHVRLPYPGDPGNAWVLEYLSEFRAFPTGSHDDQVDASTQALEALRDPGRGMLTVPGEVGQGVPGTLLRVPQSRAQAAKTERPRVGLTRNPAPGMTPGSTQLTRGIIPDRPGGR